MLRQEWDHQTSGVLGEVGRGGRRGAERVATSCNHSSDVRRQLEGRSSSLQSARQHL